MKFFIILLIFLSFNSICFSQEKFDLYKIPFEFSQQDFDSQIKTENIKDESHQSQILRSYSNENELKIIRKAEALYANDDEFDLKFKNYDQEKPYWISESFDDVDIAGIITSRAIIYYQKLSSALRSKKALTKIKMLKTSFEYTSAISYQNKFKQGVDVFSDVYVVELRLSWSQHCGELCAMGFSRKKLVVFEKDLKPVAMFVSSPFGYIVS